MQCSEAILNGSGGGSGKLHSISAQCAKERERFPAGSFFFSFFSLLPLLTPESEILPICRRRRTIWLPFDVKVGDGDGDGGK